jgi:superfamily I DNA/RNA helicase
MEDGIVEIGLNADRIIHFEEWKRLGYPNADYLVVDEVQDFDESEIKILKEKANNALITYGDSAQQLYAFKNDNPLSMEDIAYLTKHPMEILVFNHRLPKKVARFAGYLESTGDELEERCQVEGIELPKVLKYNNLNEQLNAIIKIVKTRGYDDVGILLQTNKDVEEAYSYFNSNGLEVEYKFDKNKKTYSNLDFDTTLPKLTTYHSSKGLQFEAVFLPDCEDKFPNNKQDNINALYVAITRTYQDLFIMYSDNLVPFLNNITENLYETSLTTEDIDW